MSNRLRRAYAAVALGNICPECMGDIQWRERHEDYLCLACHKTWFYSEVHSNMRLKRWPEDEGECASFGDLVDPLVAAILNTHEVKPKNHNRDIPYRGYPGVESAGALPTADALTRESLTYSDEDQGRSWLHTLVGVAVQVGMEQQRRYMLGDHGGYGKHRHMYAISAAFEEAWEKVKEETPIDADFFPHHVEFEMRELLDDPNTIDELCERHSKRVDASLKQRLAEQTPEQKKAWNEMLDSILNGVN
jgi:hypothetical protein